MVDCRKTGPEFEAPFPEVLTLSKKREVEDSQLEQVNGGSGIHDPVVHKKLDQVDPDGEFEASEPEGYDLGNDMLQPEKP